MKVRSSRRPILGAGTVAVVLALGGCGDELPSEPPAPQPATLVIQTITDGLMSGADYTVRLDGDSLARIGPTASLTLPDLTPHQAALSVTDVDHFCVARTENPRSVSLEPGATASVSFEFECDPLARVSLTALESIQAADLRGRVFDLAADSALGRSTHNAEISKVAAYIAAVFEDAGLQPPPSADYIDWWTTNEGFTGPNVIGWIPGSDPELDGEYVLFVAHFDHLGYAPGSYPDSVFNGANDNASGTAALLELADAFGQADPATPRSLVFLAVSGEEEGLVGSEQYALAPAFPLDDTRVAMNFDMVGRPVEGHFYVQQVAEKDDYPSLAADLVQYVSLNGVRLFNIAGTVTRSDGRTFVAEGIDVVEFHTGIDPDYHDLTDEADLIDYEFMEGEVRLAFLLAVEMASWDGTG